MMSAHVRSALRRVVAVAAVVSAAGWLGTQIFSQESDDANRVRGLNGQLLQIYAQLQAAPPPTNATALRARAEAMLQDRLLALAALIATNPAEAERLALPVDVAADFATAFPGARAQIEARGVWQGPIEYVIEDGADFRSHRTIRAMTVGGETLFIHFAGPEPVGLKNGDILRVEGIRAGSQVAAYSGAIVGGTTAAARGPKPGPAPCSTMGPQSTVVLFVTMPGATVPTDVTQAAVADMLFNVSGTSPSLTDYWRENSYGATSAHGTVEPATPGIWYTLDRVYTDEESGQIRTAAIAAADPDVDFAQYRRIFIVMNGAEEVANPTWSGRGTIGCGSLSTDDGTFNASTSWLKADFMSDALRGAFLAIHEGGHNLGLGHSQARDFGTETLGAPGATGLVTEYGDVFASMGRGFGHYSAPHKFRLGWLTTQVQTVTGSGAFTIQPAELPAGVQALRIRRGTDNAKWLWVEYRQPTGLYDSKLSAPFTWGGALNQVVYLDAAESQIYGGALIHYEDASTGNQAHLVDFTPESRQGSTHPLVPDDFLDPPLAGSWQDPYTGVSMTTSNPTGSALTVQVSYGSGPCVESNPTVTLTPPNPSAKRGQSVTWTLTVTNNDTLPCAGKTFTLSSVLPPGWATVFSQSALTIPAATSASVTMTKTVPANAAPATYAVDASATSGAFGATAAANVTVKPGK